MNKRKELMIIITRPYNQSVQTAEYIRNYGYNCAICPMLKINQSFVQKEEISYETVDIIVITSQNAIYAISNIAKNKLILTVGDKTADIICSKGFTNVKSVNGNIQSLVQYIIENYINKSILYLRGNNITLDIKSVMENSGFCVQEIIVYKAEPSLSLDTKIQLELKKTNHCIIIFYSKATANNFIRLIKVYNLLSYLKKFIAISISKNVSEVLEQIEWKTLLIAEQPTEQSIIQLLNKQKDL